MTQIIASLQIATDIAINWATNNPILLLGQEGYESDTGKKKIGDGIKNWNTLLYFIKEIIRENITTQNIIGTDTIISSTLSYKPISQNSIYLYLNGILQNQGAGKDYSINIITRQITWLAMSGTAVTLLTTDDIQVSYLHNNEV